MLKNMALAMKGKPEVVRVSKTKLLGPILSQMVVLRPLGEGKLVMQDGVQTKNVQLARFAPQAMLLMTAQGGGPKIAASWTAFWNGNRGVMNPVSYIEDGMFASDKLRAQVPEIRMKELQKMCDERMQKGIDADARKEFANVQVLGVIVDRSPFMASNTVTRHALFEDDQGIHFVTIGTQCPDDLYLSLGKITKEAAAWLSAHISSNVIVRNAAGPTTKVDGVIRSSILEAVCEQDRMLEIIALYERGLEASERTNKPLIFHGHSLGGALNFGILALILSFGYKVPFAVVQYGGLPVISEEFAREVLKRKITCVSFMHRMDPVPWLVSLWDVLSSWAGWYGTKEFGVRVNASETSKSNDLARRQMQRQSFVGECYALGDKSESPGFLGIGKHGIANYWDLLKSPELREQNCQRLVIVDKTENGEQRINTLTAEGLTAEQLDGVIEEKQA